MADEGTTAVEEAPEAQEQQDQGAAELGDAGQRALKAVRDEARDAKRQLKAATAELAKLREASLSEQERAVAAAKTEGRTEASRVAAPRLVRAELRAAAAEAGLGRDALSGFLEYADLSKFVGEDGEPDTKAIEAAVKRLGGGRQTDFDGGARTSDAPPKNMNDLIRRQAGVG